MAILFMLGWWYGKGWAWALSKIGSEISNVGKVFAVSILLKTWFAPWKQITTTATFQTFFQSLADNTISRMIGFVIRTFMLFMALIFAIVILIFGTVMVVMWPFIPLAIVILPILFFRGVSF